MDVSEDSNYYEDYYNAEELQEYQPCKKTHVKEFSNFFLPVFYSIIFVLSMVANLTLLMLFIKYKTVRRMFPVNMVISDILFTLTLPFWAVYASTEWIFGYHSCKAITLTYMVSMYSSNFFVASMVLQRLLDIVGISSTIRTFSSPRRDTVMCISEWLLSVLAASIHINFVETQEFNKQNICTYQFKDKIGWKVYVRFQMNLLGFVIPFLMLLFSIRLSCVASKSTTFQRCMPTRCETGFTIMFFLLWFPYNTVIFLHALQDLHIFYACNTNIHFDIAIHVTECIAFMHVVINPVLYVFLNKKIRKCLKGVCRTPRDYLLKESISSSNMSNQNETIELKSVQRYHAHDQNNVCAERPGNFIPEAI